MIPADFDYYRPATLDEAIKMLQNYGPEAKLLAGGHSLLPILKARLAQPEILIDIGRIPDLKGVMQENHSILIGALTTHDEIASSPVVREQCPLLAEAAEQIGDVQVRNRGTIGGSLSHADPAADYPAAMIALDAEIVLTGPEGARSMRAENFFEGTYETALVGNEILTSVLVPIPPAGSGGAYFKVAQGASGFAVCGVAATLTLGSGGEVASASVGVTGVAALAYRASSVEEAITGKAPTAENIGAAAAHAADDVQPLEDFHASADFRRQLARVWTGRALQQAAERAGN
ncbi:MAG: xanthine dehydrogenase family protein subunit M [bacterium]